VERDKAASPAATGALPRPRAWLPGVVRSDDAAVARVVLLLATLVLLPMFLAGRDELPQRCRVFHARPLSQFFTDASFLKPLVTTLWTSAAVGLLCVAIAAPMGWLVARTDLPARGCCES